MNDKKTFKLKSTIAALLAASVLAAAALSGCGSGGETKKTDVSVVTETQDVTSIVDGVYVDENGNPVTDPSGNPIPATTSADEKTTKADGKQQSQASKTESGAASSKTESKSQTKTESKANSSSKAESQSSSGSGSGSAERKTTPKSAKTSVTKSTTKKDDSAKNLTIGGKTYNVGDKIKCTYYLMVPNMMLNFQGRVVYDASMLKKTNAYLVAPASYSSIINNKLDGKVVFNGSDLSGYDFTGEGYDFLVVEYEVLKTGATEPAITFEVITDTNDKVYSGSDGTLSNGAKIWTVYE